MKRRTAQLGYTAAAMTIVAALLVPFFLTGLFTRGLVDLGLHVDEMYSGGPKLRSIQANGYSIDVHRRVKPHMLQREKPFVQLDWKPASALPPHVSDLVDIDGDGTPDVHVSFDVPKNPKTPLRANVKPLNPSYEAGRNLSREKFSALVVRVDDAVLVRIPLAQQ